MATTSKKIKKLDVQSAKVQKGAGGAGPSAGRLGYESGTKRKKSPHRAD